MPSAGAPAVWLLSDDDLDRLQSLAEAGIVDVDSRRLLELVQRVRVAETRLDPTFACPICGRACHNQDALNRYCPGCHAFTDHCVVGICRATPTTVAGNVALCAPHAAELGLQ